MGDILNLLLGASIIISIYRKYRRYYNRHMKKSKSMQRFELQNKEFSDQNRTDNRPVENSRYKNSSINCDSTMQSDKKNEEQHIDMLPTTETSEKSNIAHDFDLQKAIIYSEILKPKFKDE